MDGSPSECVTCDNYDCEQCSYQPKGLSFVQGFLGPSNIQWWPVLDKLRNRAVCDNFPRVLCATPHASHALELTHTVVSLVIARAARHITTRANACLLARLGFTANSTFGCER